MESEQNGKVGDSLDILMSELHVPILSGQRKVVLILLIVSQIDQTVTRMSLFTIGNFAVHKLIVLNETEESLQSSMRGDRVQTAFRLLFVIQL